MKNTVKCILAAAIVSVSAVSCNKFLDVESPSTFSPSAISSNYSLVENEIFSILQSFG